MGCLSRFLNYVLSIALQLPLALVSFSLFSDNLGLVAYFWLIMYMLVIVSPSIEVFGLVLFLEINVIEKFVFYTTYVDTALIQIGIWVWFILVQIKGASLLI